MSLMRRKLILTLRPVALLQILARWVSGELAPSLHGASVCELGAGCALPSIAAAVHAGAAFVLATDLALPTMQNMVCDAARTFFIPGMLKASCSGGDLASWHIVCAQQFCQGWLISIAPTLFLNECA